jgi:thiol-disulfide isomerase/thioredoxin
MHKMIVIKSSVALVLACGLVFGSPILGQAASERQLTVHLEGVFDAKVSLLPFVGLKTTSPIAQVPGVLNGKTAVIKIPGEYLPGEFVLRIDYRAKESDSPYPSERVIYVNNQDIELFVDPPYINNDEKTKFNAGEMENTVYSAFMKENSAKRMPLDLLRQFLLSYDRPASELYSQGVKEFAQRRLEYNTWLSDQAKIHHKLYVSSLFGFQHIPEIAYSGDEKERLNQVLKNYFEGFDFNNPLIIRSREMSQFMDAYMRLYGLQATSLELRDTLFTQAGSVACEKAAQGNPQVYGWMVDYFYTGYETYDIKKGMIMLQEHINNPRCLTSKKQQITQRLEGIARLVPGALAPDFVISDIPGKDFQFHKWKPKTKYKLLLFWTTSCVDCLKLVEQLRQWHNQSANKKKLDIVAVNLDEAQAEAGKWETTIAALSAWKHLQTKQGVNSQVARDYAILSTPVMFLVGSKSNIIISVPGNFEQLIKDLR